MNFWCVIGLVAWVMLGIPVGMLVGRYLREIAKYYPEVGTAQDGRR